MDRGVGGVASGSGLDLIQPALRTKFSYWTLLRPVYQDHRSPCTVGCPAGEQIASYLRLVVEGRYREAWDVLREDNPFPGVCGRVCYHPCEPVCNRGEYDEPIAIHALERFIADQQLNYPACPPADRPRREEAVAVVGSGPAGLSCAYHLARRGYPVTVFEMLPAAGGVLRTGIPPYRLPRQVLDKEIADIEALGVRIVTGTRVGIDLGWDELEKMGFRAVFLGAGAPRERRLGIPGEDLPGVMSGLHFLSDLNLGRQVEVGRRVAVIGAGNTAMDVARSAVRIGASPVVVYRRSRAEVPAIKEEVEEAEHEGVEFLFLAAPTAIRRGADGRLELECTRMRLGPPDQRGRRSVEPSGEEPLVVVADAVLSAIGEDPDLSCLPPAVANADRQVTVDKRGATTRSGTYAGGDLSSLNRRVVDAIGDGKRAAASISDFLRGRSSREAPTPRVIPVGEIDLTQFARRPRAYLSSLPLEAELRHFEEVNLPLDEAEALGEAQRCFSCGVCTFCDRCMVYCPDLAIYKRARPDGGYEVDLDRCKGCRLCVDICPREAMEMFGSD